MSTIADSVASVNQAFTNAVNAMQEQLLAFHREAAAAVAKASESTSQLTPPASGDLDTLVGQAYDLQVARLEADKQFALDLIGAWTSQPAPRPAKAAK